IEVIASCPTTYGRYNKMPTGLDTMKYYKENSIIMHGIDPSKTDIDDKIIVGKFVDIERKTFDELLEEVRK
ncbi:MAG: 2-oxoacid:ferredoxin oxidoreductase subunit beta, partial [Candidatus Thermoplasmatota archaeon]